MSDYIFEKDIDLYDYIATALSPHALPSKVIS